MVILNGKYRIKSASSSSIILENASTINSNWINFTSSFIESFNSKAAMAFIKIDNASTGERELA